MSKLIKVGEGIIYIIFIILLLTFKLGNEQLDLYLFWQYIIDNFILLLLLLIILFNSDNWNWFSKRILYSLFFILILNTYSKLFGMDSYIYCHWYIIPLLSLGYSITLSAIFKITYKLYKLWNDGKIKFY